MNTNVQVACLQPLGYTEMVEVNGGELVASIWNSLLVSFLVNIDSAVCGFRDGWNAYKH